MTMLYDAFNSRLGTATDTAPVLIEPVETFTVNLTDSLPIVIEEEDEVPAPDETPDPQGVLLVPAADAMPIPVAEPPKITLPAPDEFSDDAYREVLTRCMKGIDYTLGNYEEPASVKAAELLCELLENAQLLTIARMACEHR